MEFCDYLEGWKVEKDSRGKIYTHADTHTHTHTHTHIFIYIYPECSLKGTMLKLKLQFSGHLMRRADSFEKTLMLGKIEGRRSGRQRMRWLDGITD